MIAPVVVVVDEGHDRRLQVGGQLIWHLVCVPLEGLVVAHQLAVGLRVEGGCQDVLDAHHTQVVPEGSGYIAGPLSLNSLVRSVIGTRSMPVRSTASWTTSMRETEGHIPLEPVGQACPELVEGMKRE